MNGRSIHSLITFMLDPKVIVAFLSFLSQPVPDPMTYASLAKSCATLAVVGGDATVSSVSATGDAPASSPSVSAGTGPVEASGNGVLAALASILDAAAVAAVGESWGASSGG